MLKTGRAAVGLAIQQLNSQSWTWVWICLSFHGCPRGMSLTVFAVPCQNYLSMLPLQVSVMQLVIAHWFWCELKIVSMTEIQLMVKEEAPIKVSILLFYKFHDGFPTHFKVLGGYIYE